ncbi:MAG: S8 family peptidase [Balneolaceae bacterium]
MKLTIMKKLSILVILIAVIGFGCDNITESSLSDEEPLTEKSDDSGQIIDGSYIVVFHKDKAKTPDPIDVQQMRDNVLANASISEDKVTAVYNRALHGFAADLTEEELQKIMEDSRVDYVEPDRVVTLAPPCGTPNGGPCEDDGDGDNDGSQATPWGIDRVGGATTYTGSNSAWVIDTGIQLDHPDLNVDANRSAVFVTRGPGSGSPDDGNGHGTHVAGTIAAIDNDIDVIGVAAGAITVAVKVLDDRGSGQYSWVIAGVDYVASNASSGDVANLSLGGPTSDALDDAIRNAADEGIFFSIAAGNDSADANDYSPARVEYNNVYTISATDSDDVFAYFSNFSNPPIEFAAPGVSVLSTWTNSGTNTISGTSMAAPHAAGVLLVTGGNASSDGTASNDPDGTADPIVFY